MPRKTRMYIPGIPVHVVQRGHNRDATFYCEDDFQFYKTCLSEALKRFKADLHAYCLMTNHVHLLITPHEEDSIQRVMQHLGRQYVQYINKTYKRSGSLWEGRHKGSLVSKDEYLLRCYCYIELNPVTATMVTKPEEYRWSSYSANALGSTDPLITHHPVYIDLASDDQQRMFHYRELYRIPLSDQDIHDIRKAVETNLILGNSKFKEDIERKLGRKVGKGERGRPRKS